MLPSVAVLGVSGYSGQELMSLLARHGGVRPVALENATKMGTAVSQHRLELVFLATPHEVSLEAAPQALAAGAKVVDLSGAFRLKDAGAFAHWYGMEHPVPELLAEAVYGLTELNGEAVVGARLVANPGCFPTSVICGLHPLVCVSALETSAGIICDAKSGVSGAGHRPAAATHFVEINENFKAYAVLRHRHVPEMVETLGVPLEDFFFTAHLLPVSRGILSTMYVKLRRPWTRQELLALYRGRYPDSGFIRVREQGTPNLHDVRCTNFCDLYLTLNASGTRAVIISCIDNLGKGAAGQAVQNMNLMLGFEPSRGLR